MASQFNLLKQQRFRPFFLVQFLGAFNDNVFKTALITLLAFNAAKLTHLDSKLLTTALPGLFILPFFLFSATAGQIADKFERSRLIRYVKLLEIGIMLLASLGFMLQQLWLLVAALFLMGTHSTLFGPIKYAYLPQHLTDHELVGGNGLVEMGSFVAILLGEILGAWIISQPLGDTLTAISVLVIAVLGYWFSRGIPHSPAPDAGLRINFNPLTATFANLKFLWQHQVIWIAIIGISWFWFYGATLLAQFPMLTKTVLRGDESVFILLLTLFSLGVGIGSLLCDKLGRGHGSLGVVLLGALGLAIFGIDFYISTTAFEQAFNLKYLFDYKTFIAPHWGEHGLIWLNWRVLADIGLIGLFGGFYIVPLYVILQTRAEKSHQSRVIAGNNIMNALFMVVSAGFSLWIFAHGYSIPQLFLVTALLHIAVTIYLCIRQPELVIAFVQWLKARF